MLPGGTCVTLEDVPPALERAMVLELGIRLELPPALDGVTVLEPGTWLEFPPALEAVATLDASLPEDGVSPELRSLFSEPVEDSPQANSTAARASKGRSFLFMMVKLISFGNLGVLP